MELKNKVAVITGGSKGLGRSLAEEFLHEGAKVAICSPNKEGVRSTATEIGALGVCADVTKEEDMTFLAQKTIEKFGKLDIWVNNAGIFRERKKAEDFDMSKVREMFEVNVMGLINGSRVALRQMKKKNSGVIINIISSVALKGRAEISTYAASKWAANGFTASIREENKDTDILILSIFPGGMKTDLFGKDISSDFNEYMDPKIVAKKIIENIKKEQPEVELVLTRKTIK